MPTTPPTTQPTISGVLFVGSPDDGELDALGAAEEDEAIELLEVVGVEEVVEGGCVEDVVGATVVVVVDEATEEDSADDELGTTGTNVDKVVVDEDDGTGAVVVLVGATVVETGGLVVVETTGTVVLD